MIDIRLKKIIGDKKTVPVEFTLQMASGSVIKIAGPSGSGKTTFLNMVAGLIKPDSGKIIIEGNLWFDAEQQINLSPQKRKVGYVFQNYALFPNMNVLQQLQYATKNQNLIADLLDFGGLGNLRKHKPSQLSGGQQQRLAILRALAIEPELLLMDEPFSALDHQTKRQIIQDLKILLDKNSISTIIVSHNLAELTDLPGNELYIGEAKS